MAETVSGATDPAPASATLLSDTPNRVVVRVQRPSPGWLLALQTAYPGWTARVNGAVAPLARANGAFVAVAVPAGDSVVEIWYDPLSVRAGAWISLAALVVVAALGLYGALSARRATRQRADHRVGEPA